MDTCFLPGIPSNGSRSQETFVFGDVIVFTCNNGYRLVGEKVTTCLAGGVANATGPLCQNINECNETVPCSNDALCIDEHGSFGCECLVGYTGNGFLCHGEQSSRSASIGKSVAAKVTLCKIRCLTSVF